MNKIDLSVPSFHLPTALAERVPPPGTSRKRVRTRHLLLAATAFEMEEKGYEGLTIEGIVSRAQMARGTFYMYFTNRADAATAVKRAYDALMRQRRPRSSAPLSAAQSIYRMNRFYVACYARNARIRAGYEILMRERPELARSRDYINHRWAIVVLRDIGRRCGLPSTIRDDPKAILAVRAVIAMADELLRETYAFQSPQLSKYAGSEEDLAKVMTFVWYRALFGADPEGIPSCLPSIAASVLVR
jgi:AcrR family transcriptional regulator